MMQTSDILEKLDIPRHKLYYLEQKGYIHPKRVPRGDLEAREFTEEDFKKIQAIWKYLKRGFKHKIAYRKAMEELNKLAKEREETMQIKENQQLKIKGRVVVGQSMKELTSMKIGGKTDFFAVPQDLDDLKLVLSFCKEKDISFFVIGNGTKLLVRDEGFKGVIVKLGERFKSIENNGKLVRVGAGVNLSTLIDFTTERGFSGIESLSGVPGTIGGAIVRNASAFGEDISQRVLSVKVLDKDNNYLTLSKEDIGFDYRSSIFLDNKDWVIIEAELELWPREKKEIVLRLEEIRRKKVLSQPISFASAGCIFKNPPPYSAGFLIQEAGCLGMKIGDAQVSLQHANFIINKGNATARDVLRLVQKIKRKVKDRFDISLEPELEIV